MYETYTLENRPAQFAGKWGKRFFGVFGRLMDTALEGVRQAMLARYVRHCPEDALPYYATDVAIPRFRADTPGELRERLKDPWTWWAQVGTETGIRNVLGILGFGTGALDTVFWDQKSGYTFDGSSWWSRFWILARQNHGFSLHTDYDTQQTALTTWDVATSQWTWECTAAGDVVEQAREYLWTYKAHYAVPVALYLKFGGGYLWDEWLFLGPNNTWSWAEFVGNIDWDTAADVTRVTWETGQLWNYDVSETGTVLTWDNAEDMTRRWGGRHRGPTD